ncbi:MAG: hypothetical protein KatS3mg057_0167 [Herpetosiphonaceae bacterium]|nr:MAG: hypothetical protein KatS3mg057_0167 [Herpetosiphonaceae bacterium]
MTGVSLAGIYPPIPTPFDEDEQLALDKLEQNLQAWIAQPLDGVVMPGSNSEAAFLSPEERVRIWRVCGEVLRGERQTLYRRHRRRVDGGDHCADAAGGGAWRRGDAGAAAALL